MKKSYLAVFERVAEANWGAWVPDVGGPVGAGDSFEAARQSVIEGTGYMLEDPAERGLAFPQETSTQVDFNESDKEPEHRHFVVEWLSIDLPISTVVAHPEGQQAA